MSDEVRKRLDWCSWVLSSSHSHTFGASGWGRMLCRLALSPQPYQLT
mgnify:CR=1 FL=1